MIYLGGGAVYGIVVAALFQRARRPYQLTAIASLIGAPAIALIIVAVMGAVKSTERFGFDPLRAILAAISVMYFSMFVLPVACGLPAFVIGISMQALLQCIKEPK